MCESRETGCVHSPRRVQRSATFLAVAAAAVFLIEVELAGFFVIVVGTFTAFSLMLAGSGPAILLGLVPLAIVLAMATVRAPRTPAPVDPESPHRPTADLPA